MTQFLKFEGSHLESVVSLSEANLIKVNILRSDYDDLSSLPPNPHEANIWFIVSGAGAGKTILAGQYHYFPIDREQVATYPVKTSKEALEDLKIGKGYIADLGENQDGKITIRKIYLAYFDPGVQVEFYQPIAVFEGDRGFVAYVPGITSQHYGE